MNDFETICRTNNLSTLKTYIAFYESKNKVIDAFLYDEGFICAAGNRALEVTMYLYEYKSPSLYALRTAFSCACEETDIDTVKFLLTKTRLQTNQVKEVLKELKEYDIYKDFLKLVKKEMGLIALNKKLEKNLSAKTSNTPRNKI